MFQQLGVKASLFLGVACLFTTVCIATDPAFELNRRALEHFDYLGQKLPATLAEFQSEFPKAQLDDERSEEKLGLVCYRIENFPMADVARFYFCDGRLYQFDAQYLQERLQKQGGMQALLRQLIKHWGPVDHAGQARWTWQRPMYSRRADFYARADMAQLTITDMAWLPIVTQRREGKLTVPESIGF